LLVELQKVLDADDGHIKRWTKDADIFTEACVGGAFAFMFPLPPLTRPCISVKGLRDPIHDIYKEFFPNERSDDVFDSTVGRVRGFVFDAY
jgi:hypothetical protein